MLGSWAGCADYDRLMATDCAAWCPQPWGSGKSLWGARLARMMPGCIRVRELVVRPGCRDLVWSLTNVNGRHTVAWRFGGR